MSVDEDLQVESNSDLVESLTQRIEQLEVAVDHRTTIGQAQGILMERLSIDAETAFEYLKRVSSHTNRKLIDVAAEIAHTLELPETES